MQPPASSRLWQFANAEFDEDRRELHVDGVACQVEAKPLAVLLELLRRGGEVATKQALLDAVWDGREVSPGSLPTAVNKLRLVLGDADRRVIEAVPRTGYRIGVKVRLARARARAEWRVVLAEGAHVPGRPEWRLERKLEAGAGRLAWRACHASTAHRRVFAFAETDAEAEGLRAELAASRHLGDALGERDDIVPLVDAEWDARPCFVACPDPGPDLRRWAEARGGLQAVPLAERIGLVERVARAVGAAHGVGVLHGAIRPEVISVATGAAGLVRPSVRGFGAVQAAAVLGWPPTAAPELRAGGAPTVASDVHALGILLFQVMAGDLDRPVGAGWARDVADPLLRADIAAAAAADPGQRLSSATLLADRLASLDARRAEAEARVADFRLAQDLAEAARRARQRRPWIAVAVTSLVGGLLLASGATVEMLHQRDRARAQAKLAEAVTQFVTVDLLGRGIPAISGRTDETLMEAAGSAEARIGTRFARQPVIAGAIWRTLALAFDSRGATAPARDAYAQAVAEFERAEGPGSPEAAILRLRRVQMEVQSGEPGSLATARGLLAAAAPRAEALGMRSPEALVWLFNARGMLGMAGVGDVQAARADFRAASALAETLPDTIDAESRFSLAEHAAYAAFRLGDWAQARTAFGALLRQQMQLHGAHHPDTLLVRLNLAQVQMAAGQPAAAVQALDGMLADLVAVYGPAHRLTFTAIGARAQAEAALGRYGDAARDQARLYASNLALHGAQSFYTFGALSDMAVSECRAGDTASGWPHARSAYEAARATFGAGNAIAQAIGEAAAFCAVAGGQYAAAGPLLEHVDAQGVAQFTAQPDFPAELDLLQAAIASGTGDPARARVLLRSPASVFSRPGADPYLRDWTAKLRASLRS